MSSRSELLRHSGGSWPREGFTLAENLADLQEHEQEQIDRVAFTYTVMNPTETECLGCVYIRPFELIRSRVGAGDEQNTFPQTYVTFWVRSSRVADDLDRHLLQTLISWFRTDWAFERIGFLAMNEQKRQQHILQDAGLLPTSQLPKAVLFTSPISI